MRTGMCLDIGNIYEVKPLALVNRELFIESQYNGRLVFVLRRHCAGVELRQVLCPHLLLHFLNELLIIVVVECHHWECND